MAQPFPGTVFRILDNSGNPVAGALVYAYEAGTTTPKAVYTDATLSVSAGSVVTADASGFAKFWLGSGAYKFRVTMPVAAGGAELTAYAADNITAPLSVEDLASGATVQTWEFTATSGQTTYSVAPLTPALSAVSMEVNGIAIKPSSLSVAASTITFPALQTGDEAVIRIFTSNNIGGLPPVTNSSVASSAAISTNKLAYGTRSVTSKLAELPSVVDNGADPTGANNSVTAFNSSTTVTLIPQGTYKTDTTPTGPQEWIGIGTTFTGSAPFDSWAPASSFGLSTLEVVSTNGKNALIGMAYNNAASGVASFPTAVTAYGRVNGNGNIVFGLFGRADLYATGGGVATNEVNCFNYAGSPSSAYPPSLGFGTTERSPVGLIVAAGGDHNSHIGVMLAQEGESPRSFRTGFYSHPKAVTDYGLFIDADATDGPTLSALVKHKSASIALQLQTVGTAAPDNAVLAVVNPSAATVFGVRQNGRVAFTSGITQTTVGAAGGASALPANPTGYLKFLVGSTEFVIPYYAAA